MSIWKTTLNHIKRNYKPDEINIHRVIFQGDTLSLLLVFASLIALNSELNNMGEYGYNISQNTISHLFYRNDLKLYVRNESELKGPWKTLRCFFHEIGI